MLSTEQTSIWQRLLTILSNLPTDSLVENLPSAIPDLKLGLRQAIELFEGEILTQNIEDIQNPNAGKMRSYLTESHRLLRLMPLDVMFMEVSRNPTTTQERRQAYQDRLALSIRYVEAMMSISCS